MVGAGGKNGPEIVAGHTYKYFQKKKEKPSRGPGWMGMGSPLG